MPTPVIYSQLRTGKIGIITGATFYIYYARIGILLYFIRLARTCLSRGPGG